MNAFHKNMSLLPLGRLLRLPCRSPWTTWTSRSPRGQRTPRSCWKKWPRWLPSMIHLLLFNGYSSPDCYRNPSRCQRGFMKCVSAVRYEGQGARLSSSITVGVADEESVAVSLAQLPLSLGGRRNGQLCPPPFPQTEADALYVSCSGRTGTSRTSRAPWS